MKNKNIYYNQVSPIQLYISQVNFRF